MTRMYPFLGTGWVTLGAGRQLGAVTDNGKHSYLMLTLITNY